MCKVHREQLWVGAVYIIRIFYCNTLLFCSSHTSSRITSAPMNCFVIFSQSLINALSQDAGIYGTLMSELDGTSQAMFKVILTGYGFWNLDYFRHLIALRTFVEAFQGCYKNGVSEGWDFRSISGVYVLTLCTHSCELPDATTNMLFVLAVFDQCLQQTAYLW